MLRDRGDDGNGTPILAAVGQLQFEVVEYRLRGRNILYDRYELHSVALFFDSLPSVFFPCTLSSLACTLPLLFALVPSFMFPSALSYLPPYLLLSTHVSPSSFPLNPIFSSLNHYFSS